MVVLWENHRKIIGKPWEKMVKDGGESGKD